MTTLWLIRVKTPVTPMWLTQYKGTCAFTPDMGNAFAFKIESAARDYLVDIIKLNPQFDDKLKLERVDFADAGMNQ